MVSYGVTSYGVVCHDMACSVMTTSMSMSMSMHASLLNAVHYDSSAAGHLQHTLRDFRETPGAQIDGP